ncbi:uncharacterized protein LOC34619218 [Cyclospora cayetanensis]|uniref:Uncharacterized protein LOC34619218 n=1 Tax=Cyclospora cayetanensis TaxID=88456 RepID=A0A6P6RRF5_9EIME|nr:uncharacterized protein LOC34619218 [Cyclospora cayetanensis]
MCLLVSAAPRGACQRLRPSRAWRQVYFPWDSPGERPSFPTVPTASSRTLLACPTEASLQFRGPLRLGGLHPPPPLAADGAVSGCDVSSGSRARGGGSCRFASGRRGSPEAFWETEFLAHELKREVQKVDDAEKEQTALTGQQPKSVWQSEELLEEFHRTVGRKRRGFGMQRSPAAGDAGTAAASPDGTSASQESSSSNDASLDFVVEKADPSEALFDYVSLRNGDYRDLTHQEAMRMQDAYQQKLLLDRRVRWLKARALPDPERDAAAVIRNQTPQSEDSLVKSLGLDDGVRAARRLVRMEADAERQELASRIRAKMREEKLANAKLMKAALPNVQGQVVDPIKFHVARRTIRQARLLQSQLEEFLTWNSAEVLHGLLGGASVSLHHVEQQTTKSVCYVFFTVASRHDPKDVEERLNRAAPHFRMQMARRLELGFTPPFRFVHHEEDRTFSKHSLFKVATERPPHVGSTKTGKQQTIASAWAKTMNRIG